MKNQIRITENDFINFVKAYDALADDKILLANLTVEQALEIHVSQEDRSIVDQIMSLKTNSTTKIFKSDYINNGLYQTEEIKELAACQACFNVVINQ